MKTTLHMFIFLLFFLVYASCKEGSSEESVDLSTAEQGEFYFGADLSYVNQVVDYGGTYRDYGVVSTPYKIFKDHGSNVVRLRLWHNPSWTKEVYGAAGTQLYNNLSDVSKSISLAKEQGLAVLLDIHYSDTWADPGKQEIPAAWKDIKSMSVLEDSVYNYTVKVFRHLSIAGLIPEFVQIGNETNCGMLYTNAVPGFPVCNVCNGEWMRMGNVVKSAIAAVREVTGSSTIKTKVILHVADPKNVEWWFDNMIDATKGGLKDFDMIGFSYYPIWHTTVGIEQVSDYIANFKHRYGKPVWVLETAYPWNTAGNDDYNNVFGSETPLNGYPFSETGQFDLMVKLTQEVIDGGGLGVIYWEPAWISSNMKDLWGTGSSWENCTFFDFNGNSIKGIDFMNYSFK